MEKKPKPPSLRHRLTHLDTTLSLHIHTICQPFPRPLLKALEISGDGLFWIPIPIALFFTPLASKSVHVRFLLVGLFIGFLFDLTLVGLIKYLVRRPRPVYNTGIHLTFSVDHWSFPSGHSSRVCFIAAFLYLSMETVYQAVVQLKSSGNRFFSETIDPDGKTVELFFLSTCLWSAATSVSRVFLGRHFVFDVIAGACVGVFEAFVVYYVMNFLNLEL